jgi:hypothetical protein
MWRLWTEEAFINDKRVWIYDIVTYSPRNWQPVNSNSIIHEMLHSMSAVDLYTSDGNIPVINDLMCSSILALSSYTKYRYLRWIQDIPLITTSGTYTLKPNNSQDHCAYRILSPNSTTEYFLLEYRRISLPFWGFIIGEGLQVSRINSLYDALGNYDGPPFEMYTYRINGTLNNYGQIRKCAFSADSGRTAFNDTTNPSCFLSDGSPGGLDIHDIGNMGDSISFKVTLPKSHNGPWITFSVSIPSRTPASEKLYIAGNFNFWDPGSGQVGTDGREHDLLMHNTGVNQWQITLPFTSGQAIEYKYTRGSWGKAEKGAAGEEMANRKLTVPGAGFAENDVVASWADKVSVADRGVNEVTTFQLFQNYPNPFNAVTMIRYDIPRSGHVYLDIFNVRGETVKRLVDHFEEAGSHQILFNASTIPSGIYLYAIAAGEHVRTRKLLLIR